MTISNKGLSVRKTIGSRKICFLNQKPLEEENSCVVRSARDPRLEKGRKYRYSLVPVILTWLGLPKRYLARRERKKEGKKKSR